MARLMLGSVVLTSFRGVGEAGGTSTTTTIATVDADNSTISLQGYATANVAANSMFRGTLQAYKLSD